jgi:hypothetical protein
MIEWIIIIILVAALLLSIHLLRNMFQTLNNIQVRLAEIYFLVEDYDDLVKTLNTNETYYGDSTIEAFVKMSNQLNESLKTVLDMQRELTGELDAEETHQA